MNIADYTILITGGASGIGFALAEGFVKKGGKVRICDRKKESLEQVRDAFPEIDVFQCDLMDKEQRKELYRWATSDGSLNMLVNNAGIQRTFIYTDSRNDEYAAGENEIEINLAAPIHLCEMFIPYLMKKADSVILNVASSLAVVHNVTFPVYCATKAAVHAFTRCIREQLANSTVKVFEALPPAVKSGLNPEGRAMEAPRVLVPADEYAAYVIRALEADKYEIYAPLMDTLEKKNLAELYEYFKDPKNPR